MFMTSSRTSNASPSLQLPDLCNSYNKEGCKQASKLLVSTDFDNFLSLWNRFSLYANVSVYIYIYIWHLQIHVYMYIYIHNTITHPLQPLKKMHRQGTHGILPAQTQATPKLCEERRSRSQASTVATNHGWIKWIGLGAVWSPVFQMNPTIYRGTNGTSGTMAWFFGHFSKAVGLIAGDFKKNLFHDFHRLVGLSCAPTQTQTTHSCLTQGAVKSWKNGGKKCRLTWKNVEQKLSTSIILICQHQPIPKYHF